VRDLPYAIDGAHDADGLLVHLRGDCLAKSELLMLAAWELGIPARYVCWLYLLPDVVREVGDLPSRLDAHRAVQMRVSGRWMLADATHHPGLRHTALMVNDWVAGQDTITGPPTCRAGDRGGRGADRRQAGMRTGTALDRDPARPGP